MTPFVHVASQPGEVFDVAVNISAVEDLHSYSLIVTYDTALLGAVQVIRGGSFPEESSFEFTIYEPEGLIEVNASFPPSSTALWGDGTLARISFTVAQPSTENAQYCIISLEQTQIYDTELELIDYCPVGGIYFWKAIQPSQLQEERLIDIFTKKGGKGPGESGGTFILNELVCLTAYVTYNDWPQQNLLVAFQVIDPSGETVFLDVMETDEDGYATVCFRIPDLEGSLGRWSVFASVDVACEIVWDSLEYDVIPMPVGGTSHAVDVYGISSNATLYAVAVIVLTVGLLGIRRRMRTSSPKEV